MIRARTGGVGATKKNTSGAAMRARPGGAATRNTPGVDGAATG